MGFSFCYRCLSVITEENRDSVAVSGNFFYFLVRVWGTTYLYQMRKSGETSSSASRSPVGIKVIRAAEGTESGTFYVLWLYSRFRHLEFIGFPEIKTAFPAIGDEKLFRIRV